jgi:hypothetical protein
VVLQAETPVRGIDDLAFSLRADLKDFVKVVVGFH